MNKICTDIEQSEKLIELGIDVNTADMWWNYYTVAVDDTTPRIIHIDEPWVGSFNWENKPDNIPAWSLTALLELIPNYVINKVDDKIYANLYYGFKSSHDNLVDAAYEMICQLKENGKI